ncbi:hypothetical protein FOZ62_002212, partial [Perkinsus olseni]
MGVGQSSPLKKGTQLNGRGLLLFFGAKPLVCQRVTILWTISFALELFLSPSDGGHINVVIPCACSLCGRGPHQDRYGDSKPLQLLLHHVSPKTPPRLVVSSTTTHSRTLSRSKRTPNEGAPPDEVDKYPPVGSIVAPGLVEDSLSNCGSVHPTPQQTRRDILRTPVSRASSGYPVNLKAWSPTPSPTSLPAVITPIDQASITRSLCGALSAVEPGRGGFDGRVIVQFFNNCLSSKNAALALDT